MVEKFKERKKFWGFFLLSCPITFLFEKKMTFLTVFLLNLYGHMPLDFIVLYRRQFQNEFMPLLHRAEVLTIFCSYFGRNDDFMNSF